MTGDRKLFLEARRRRARRILRRRIGWVVGILALSLAISLFSLILVIRDASAPTLLPSTALLPVVVEVTADGFSPAVVIVQPGAEIRWVVRDGAHTVTSDGGEWDSGRLEEEVYLRTMPLHDAAILFLEYHCEIHGRSASIHLLPPPRAAAGAGV